LRKGDKGRWRCRIVDDAREISEEGRCVLKLEMGGGFPYTIGVIRTFAGDGNDNQGGLNDGQLMVTQLPNKRREVDDRHWDDGAGGRELMRRRDEGDGSRVECWTLATTIESRVGLRREASSSSMWTEPAEIARMNSNEEPL
jgi:hypothetical protein